MTFEDLLRIIPRCIQSRHISGVVWPRMSFLYARLGYILVRGARGRGGLTVSALRGSKEGAAWVLLALNLATR